MSHSGKLVGIKIRNQGQSQRCSSSAKLCDAEPVGEGTGLVS